MDKQTESRAAFEAEFKRRHSYIADDLEALFKQYNFGTDDEPDYNYYSLAVRDAWEWWQSSRESLVVELPETHAHLIWIQAGRGPDDYWDDVEISRSEQDKCCDGSDRYEVYAKWQIEELLSSIGIRIKGEGNGASS